MSIKVPMKHITSSELVLIQKTVSFSNGVAECDLTSNLTSLGFRSIKVPIVAQVQAGTASANVVRGCVRNSDLKSIKIYANSSSYTDNILINILVEAVR